MNTCIPISNYVYITSQLHILLSSSLSSPPLVVVLSYMLCDTYCMPHIDVHANACLDQRMYRDMSGTMENMNESNDCVTIVLHCDGIVGDMMYVNGRYMTLYGVIDTLTVLTVPRY